MSFQDEIEETKKKLNSVSPSLCLAKWKQVTIHLQNGQTHSCHHPNTHSIPLSELKSNPSALHNTNFKKSQRKLMLEGKRPSECQYCWNIEDLGPQFTSDRHFKSNDQWAKDSFNEVVTSAYDANPYPSYLEVSFSHKCNFKCLYCFPHISSLWESEIQQSGPYQLSYAYNDISWLQSMNKLPLNEGENPYVEAFWKWWPDLYPHLKVMRITGGEPLLAESTKKIIDYIKLHPRPELELAINSNLGSSKTIVKNFCDNLAQTKNHLKTFSLFTSVDTWGPQAEYIRTGLKLGLFEENLNYVLNTLESINLTFMCTFNALSVPNFTKFLNKVLELKKSHSKNGREIIIDISYLRYPDFLSVHILSDEIKILMNESLAFMKSNIRSEEKIGFHEYEIEKMERLIEFGKSCPPDFDQKKQQLDFLNFIRQADQRRKTDFLKTFPELNAFYKQIEQLEFS